MPTDGQQILVTLLLGLVAASASATTIYVDDNAPVGGDGTSWADAFTHLQDGLAEAVSGDEIRVAQGNYKPDQDEAGIVIAGDRAATFQLVNGVGLYGGYRGCPLGDCSGDADERGIVLYETILSGDLNGDDGPDWTNNGENSFHVVTATGLDGTAVLDGFTITAGNANGAGLNAQGGGVVIGTASGGASSPTLINCTFRENSAVDNGGGMYNGGANAALTNCFFDGNIAGASGGGMYIRFGDPTLRGCTFSRNVAGEVDGGGGGGGIYNEFGVPVLANCIFSGNSARGYSRGGGMYNDSTDYRYSGRPTLTGCIFSGNSAAAGGGMYNSSYSASTSPTLTNCTFSRNHADGNGGGMYNFSEFISLSTPRLTSCTFSGNSAGGNGGGMYNSSYRTAASSSPRVINCTFSWNTAAYNGGGMYNDGNSNPTLTNCTFSGNSANEAGGIWNYLNTPVLANCILWGNTASNATDESAQFLGGTPYIDYTCIQGWSGLLGGTGNIGANPLFVDPDGPDDTAGTEDDNLRLSAYSPCIDAGSNLVVPTDTVDLDGDGDTAEPTPFDLAGNPRFLDDLTAPNTGAGTIPIVDMGAYEQYTDCNDNGVPDQDDISSGASEDCTGNGVPDECEPDCQPNGTPDSCDIADGTSVDCSGNGIPDECEHDCNDNGIADSCDIDAGLEQDCNTNGAPDSCEIANGTSPDCNANGIPDDCDWAAYQTPFTFRASGRAAANTPHCQLPDQQMHGGAFVVPLDQALGSQAAESFTFSEATTLTGIQWWGTYRDQCGESCDPTDGFSLTIYTSDSGPARTVLATYDLGATVQRTVTGETIWFETGYPEYEYSAGLVPPLAAKLGQRYWVEIRNVVDAPCVWSWETAPEGGYGNGASLYDPVGDGFDASDFVSHDLAFCVTGLPAAQDCNTNGIDDAQDIFDGTSQDIQGNSVPDECEDDRNFNTVPDDWDIVEGTSRDRNFNGVPDEADCPTRPGDFDGDCDVDVDDLARFLPCLGLSGVLVDCTCADFDLNGTIDLGDYLAFSVAAGTVDDSCRIAPEGACPDSWTTTVAAGGPVGARAAGTASFYDFGLHGPIPAGFFGDGSDPFSDVVTLIGTPADPNGVQGEVDTQIQHGPVVFDANGIAQTPIDILTLNLISQDPITVTYNGGQNPEQWLVVAGLSPNAPASGDLIATLDAPGANAGTFDAVVYVQPSFLFVKYQDVLDHLLPECVAVRVLDTGGLAANAAHADDLAIADQSALAMPPIELTFTGEPFVRTADPSIVAQAQVSDCAQGSFVPGVIETGGRGLAAATSQQLTCTSHITTGEAHSFCPPECDGPAVCKYGKMGLATPMAGCKQVPRFPDAVLGSACGGGCSGRQFRMRPCPELGFALQTYGNPTCVSRASTCRGACCTDDGQCVRSTEALCGDCYAGDGVACDATLCALSTERSDTFVDVPFPDCGGGLYNVQLQRIRDACGNTLELWCMRTALLTVGRAYIVKYNNATVGKCIYACGVNGLRYYLTVDGHRFHSIMHYTGDALGAGDAFCCDQGTPGKWDWLLSTYNCIGDRLDKYCRESTSRPSRSNYYDPLFGEHSPACDDAGISICPFPQRDGD